MSGVGCEGGGRSRVRLARVDATGEIFDDDYVLVIRRITVSYRLAGVPADRKGEVEVERVHGFHARFCPVARSLERAIEIHTELSFI